MIYLFSFWLCNLQDLAPDQGLNSAWSESTESYSLLDYHQESPRRKEGQVTHSFIPSLIQTPSAAMPVVQ